MRCPPTRSELPQSTQVTNEYQMRAHSGKVFVQYYELSEKNTRIFFAVTVDNVANDAGLP